MRSVSAFMVESAGLLCPLVFSVTGLLVGCATFIGGGNDVPPTLRFALVAGAPALAAIAAIKMAGDDHLTGDGNLGRR